MLFAYDKHGRNLKKKLNSNPVDLKTKMYVNYVINILIFKKIYITNKNLRNVSITADTCLDVLFYDHGPQTEGITDTIFSSDLILCHEECRNNEGCFGYTYDGTVCSLNEDKNFITGSPCLTCHYYEKTCQSRTYKTVLIFHDNQVCYILSSVIYVA